MCIIIHHLTNGLIHSFFQSISSMWWSRSYPAPHFPHIECLCCHLPTFTSCLQNKGKAFQTTSWPPTPWDQVASMPLLIFLQFLLHPKMSVLYQIQQGTHATWIFLKKVVHRDPLEIRSKQCVGKNVSKNDRSCIYFRTRIGWWMNSLSFIESYPCNNKPKPKSKRSTVKVLVCYYHTATYTHWGMYL